MKWIDFQRNQKASPIVYKIQTYLHKYCQSTNKYQFLQRTHTSYREAWSCHHLNSSDLCKEDSSIQILFDLHHLRPILYNHSPSIYMIYKVDLQGPKLGGLNGVCFSDNANRCLFVSTIAFSMKKTRGTHKFVCWYYPLHRFQTFGILNEDGKGQVPSFFPR